MLESETVTGQDSIDDSEFDLLPLTATNLIEQSPSTDHLDEAQQSGSGPFNENILLASRKSQTSKRDKLSMFEIPLQPRFD